MDGQHRRPGLFGERAGEMGGVIGGREQPRSGADDRRKVSSRNDHVGGRTRPVPAVRPGQIRQPGVLRAADPVLDRGVRAVSGVEVSELPEPGVGRERGVAPAVGFFERVELRPG